MLMMRDVIADCYVFLLYAYFEKVSDDFLIIEFIMKLKNSRRQLAYGWLAFIHINKRSLQIINKIISIKLLDTRENMFFLPLPSNFYF